jgi:hypothetical protein
MITIRELAVELDRDVTAIRRRCLQHGIPMGRAINPGTHQEVLVLDKDAERALRALYPKRLIALPAAVATEGVAA